MVTGGCHCGAVRYTVVGEAEHHALCHCEDCRRSAGAPVVGWIAFKADQVTIEGEPVTYASSGHGRRRFCGRCGTGLFYTNDEYLPGIVDIQSATLDEPAGFEPGAHIQYAERLGWIERIGDLPRFERYPGA